MRNLTCTQAGGTTFCRNYFFRMWKTRCLVVAKNQIRPQARTKLAMIIDWVALGRLACVTKTSLHVPSSVSLHTDTFHRSRTSRLPVLIGLTANVTDTLASMMQVQRDEAARIPQLLCNESARQMQDTARREVQDRVGQQQFQLQKSARQAQMRHDLQRETTCKCTVWASLGTWPTNTGSVTPMQRTWCPHTTGAGFSWCTPAEGTVRGTRSCWWQLSDASMSSCSCDINISRTFCMCQLRRWPLCLCRLYVDNLCVCGTGEHCVYVWPVNCPTATGQRDTVHRC